MTIKEWAAACYNAVGKTPTFINVFGEIEQRNYFPFSDYGYCLDTSAQSEILPELTPMETGLTRAYKWYKNNKSAINSKNYFDFIKNNLI